ncbi:putative lysine-specific demethylase JMJ14-like [Capsicum annuum]|nr:putative lysine-specific demethylase JMJ14-like [Capsicum annuum]
MSDFSSSEKVSFSALRKDVVNILDIMERLKNEEDQKTVDMADQIEKLKFYLAFICTNLQLSYSVFEQFKVTTSASREVAENRFRPIWNDVHSNVRCKYNMHQVLLSLMDNIDDCISSCHYSITSAIMTEEQLDFLLLNLHHVYKFLAEIKFPLVTQYKILRDVCSDMKDFHGLIVNGCVEHKIVEYVLPQLQPMAERIGLFLLDVLINKDTGVLKLVHLLLKIIPIELEVMHICFTNLKASSSVEFVRFMKQLLNTTPDILREYLIHLQEHMVNVITSSTSGARNIHVMIEFLLIILTDFWLMLDFIHHDKLFYLLARVATLTREVSTLVHDLEENSRNEESINGTNHANLELLENIELLKKDLKKVYLKAPDSCQCYFPMNDGPLFMHLLHRHLNDLLDSNAYSVALIKEEIGQAKQDLEFIASCFENIDHELYKDLWARVLDVAYETKDVIDSIIVRDNGLLHLIFSLPLTIKKIKLIKEKVSDLHEMIPKNRGLTVVNSIKKPVESKSLTASKIIVGFEKETHWIISKLTSGPKDLDVISITGMPGSGKTTLAYQVYNDESVSRHFDIRAWCTIGQEYDKKELLEKVYKQVTGSDSKLSENIDVADELRRHLIGKRYLIFLDDLWDTDTWDKLKRPFPVVENGSRMILTTRKMEVALYGKHNTDPLNLRLLRSEETWELLEKRAFGEESCPNELLDVGKEIAQNCNGLPLVADLIAGVIAGREKKKTAWLEIRNNLKSYVFNSEVDVMKVIELSYDHLPHHLKPCLLYLASSPKSSGLKVNWPAQGLVEQTDMKSMVYFDDLISSSLVTFINEIGNEPIFLMHELISDFCLIKAKEEKLFDLISSSALSSSSSSSHLMSRIVTFIYDKENFELDNFVLFSSTMIRHSVKHLYSLYITGDEMEDHLSDICHLRDLRLLRVLQLSPSFIIVKDSLLNEIGMLNHLRFLHIGTEVKYLPSSFSNLWNLETMSVENEGSILVLFPIIWDLLKLRVLRVSDCSFFDMDTDEPILITVESKLENLRALSSLMLSYSNETEDIFERFPNLQQLKFSLKESWNYSTEQIWFPQIDFLTELEDLFINFESSNSNDSGPSVAINWSWDFHFPSNLKKLWLFNFPLTSDPLSTIARLPNLEELFLTRIIIQGGEWNMGEDIFENLKYLGLFEVTLSKWKVGEESFPILEKLELLRCRKLEEIPPCFGDIYSLKIIILTESPQLEDSALKIKQYVGDMTGGDEFHVRIS